jgi:hypothetical protein
VAVTVQHFLCVLEQQDLQIQAAAGVAGHLNLETPAQQAAVAL